MAVASASLSTGTLSPEPSIARSSATFGPGGGGHSRKSSLKSNGNDMNGKKDGKEPKRDIPEVNLNGTPLRTPRPRKSSNLNNGNVNGGAGAPGEGEGGEWGSQFWVTLVDPQTGTSFFACPATGQVSWDPPVGNFVLPPNETGEWWELSDESRGGIAYYYQTKTGETVWERPEGFVIPLGIIQNTGLGRRLSKTTFHRNSIIANENRGSVIYSNTTTPTTTSAATPKSAQRSKSFHRDSTQSQTQTPQGKRSYSSDTRPKPGQLQLNQLPPIPGSPYQSAAEEPGTPNSRKSSGSGKSRKGEGSEGAVGRNRSKSSSYVPKTPPAQSQSLRGAAEFISQSPPSPSIPRSGPTSPFTTNGRAGERRSTSDSGHSKKVLGGGGAIPDVPRLDLSLPRLDLSLTVGGGSTPTTKNFGAGLGSPGGSTRGKVPPSPSRPIPPTPNASIRGRDISGPVLDHAATMSMNPVRGVGAPIPVNGGSSIGTPTAVLASGSIIPILPHDLASDIQQFSESQYAKQYFSTHRTGFIFRRTVPVAQMMTWQKGPLNNPLLTIPKTLRNDAVKIFKVIQRIMGDREREPGRGVPRGGQLQTQESSGEERSTVGLLEEERWLLGEGLTHGELRDEIYCQCMKQLSGNQHSESVFKGWQLLCVLLVTFPPSKNFEAYLRSFIQQHTTHQEGRVDVMAKHCHRRLAIIAKKGPRGKPPSIAEIETASDAAFNPSTFGESLDAIIRLQERNYPHQKVPIILPFLADGMLALGGTKSEGIFRVPGDGDAVSELKLRIDRGYYTLDDVDDPNILASLMKLWLRELCDPLVPEEMYNDCITNSKDPSACVQMIHRLPTINRRVMLFVISFMQMFLKEDILAVTKMTPANMAVVMAPNLLRCNSDSMSVVFTNAQYEQIFVYNLLIHLKCNEVDPDYTPSHGIPANVPVAQTRASKSRTRRSGLNH